MKLSDVIGAIIIGFVTAILGFNVIDPTTGQVSIKNIILIVILTSIWLIVNAKIKEVNDKYK